MDTPSYIASNLEELFDQAPKDIQDLIYGDAVNNATATLGKIYRIPVSSYVSLSNLISFILIGALQPKDVPRAFMEVLGLSEEDATKLSEDLEKSILEKARVRILGKSPAEMVELTFPEGRSPDELRKEILDTTKRESALTKEQSSSAGESKVEPVEPSSSTTQQTGDVKKVVIAPGSRSQLMEQLQVLDSIPDDDEIAERLSKIQEQIASIEKKEGNTLDSNIPLQNFMFGEKGDQEVEAESKSATYSKAPTKYNVDPYREAAEEV